MSTSRNSAGPSRWRVAQPGPRLPTREVQRPPRARWLPLHIHTAIDDRTRIAYSEILTDEKAVTATGFWKRAAGWYISIAINPQRVITDNGSRYRSGLWHKACAETGTVVKKTRPYRPQINGKVERFYSILLEEWAYIRPWTSDRQRTNAYDGFIHSYIATETTDSSDGQAPTASSRTTSPKSTTRPRTCFSTSSWVNAPLSMICSTPPESSRRSFSERSLAEVTMTSVEGHEAAAELASTH